MPKVTSMIIGLLFVGLMASIFALGLASVNDKYSITYDEGNFSTYNQLVELNNVSESIKTDEEGIEVDKENENDILGAIFDSGYRVLRTAKRSIGIYDTVTEQALQETDLGGAGRSFKLFFGTIVVILLILGVVISAIAKWRL